VSAGLGDGVFMTLFLTLVCGVLIIVLFTQVSGVRKGGRAHERALKDLFQRIELLEELAASEPAPARAQAAARTSVAAAVAPPPETTAPVAPPPAAEPRPVTPPSGTPVPYSRPTYRPAPPSEQAVAPVRPEAPRAPAPEQPVREPVAAGPVAGPVAPKPPAGPTLGDRIAAQLRIGWDQWIAQNLLAVAGGIFVLLGASFFVAVAISNGWLTPWRQVVAALTGGALLLAAGWRAWPADASRRASHILSQSLVGTGAGVMLLAVVAGARIYDQPLYPSWVGLVGAGAISALVVAIAVRWNAQVTAGLGITTAIAAPLLVDAPPTTATIAFLLLALAGSAIVIALRGWPWLLQVAIIASLPQPALWAIDDRLAGDQQPMAVAVAILVAWWALLALPALLFEVRAASTRLRMPTSSALFQVAGLAVLFGRLEFGSVHATGFEVLLCVLAACHLVAGGVMLRVRPASRPGAVFVWSIGAALAAGAGAVLLGGAAQPAFWAVETLAMLWLYVRFDDRQAGVTAALLGVLTLGWSISLAPPEALAHPLGEFASGVLVTGVLAFVAVVVLCIGSALLLRGVRRAAIAFAAAAWVALLYLVAVATVGLAAPAGGGVDQRAQLFVTGAWALLATAGVVASLRVPQRYRLGVGIAAELSLWAIAVKAFAIDSLALGLHEQRLLWVLAVCAGLAAVLAAVERWMPAGRSPLPLATPFACLLVLSGLTQPGFDAYRAGTPHLLATSGVLALAIAAGIVALWRFAGRLRADALVAVVVLVVEAVALAMVTLVTPHLGETSENALRAVSVGPLAIGLALLGGAMLVRRLPVELRQRAVHCMVGVLALAGVLTVGTTAAYGATGGAIVVAVFWLVAAAALSLSLRRRPADELLLAAAAVAVGLCAFALVTTAPPRALAFGAEHGWWALAAAAIAAAAAAIATVCAPRALRATAFPAALAVALYGGSVLIVTALTPTSHHVSHVAQLALSVGWVLAGVALLGAGIFRTSQLTLVLRACGTAVVGVAAALMLVDTAAFGVTRGALAVAAVWLAATAALGYAVRRRPDDQLLLGSAVVAVGACAFTLVATAPPDALAYGAEHGWWALAAAVMAAAAAGIAALCAPLAWRTFAIPAALFVALYGVSVLVVTALTPDSGHTTQVAQLALSVVWTLWGVALLAGGVLRASTLGVILRRGGIALAGIAAAKVLIVDTARFDTAHRAGVFLALGLILLAGAWAYAKLTKKLEPEPAGA
jgi:uncharacterized membrane protein